MIKPNKDKSLPKYHEKICRDMVRRGVPGCFMYLVVWLAVVLVGDYFTSYPAVAYGGIIALALLSIFRSWLSLDFDRLYLKDPLKWENGYGIAVTGTALTWSLLSVILFIEFLPEDPLMYVIGIAISGFSHGGTTALFSHMRLQRAHQTLLLLPTSLACFYVGGALPITMGIFLLFGWGYLLSIGKEMHTQYHTALKTNEILEQLASTDKLTNIYNRRYFDELLNPTAQHAIRQKQQVTILMLDVDFFKLYNDTYGHAKGDQCLKSLANTLSENFRRGTDLVARYGGEEFVALTSELSFKDVDNVITKLMDDIRALGIPHAGSFAAPHITVSIGAVTFTPASDVDMNSMVEKADDLLYRAKSKGRNMAIIKSLDEDMEKTIQPKDHKEQ